MFGEGATRRETPHLLRAPLARACSFLKACTPGNTRSPPHRLHGGALGVRGLEPRGESNIQPDGGRGAIPPHPAASRWSRARWRGWGRGAARCARGRRGHGSPSPPSRGQLCGLGRFPATESGQQAISPVPGPAPCAEGLWGCPAHVCSSTTDRPHVRVCPHRGGPWPSPSAVSPGHNPTCWSRQPVAMIGPEVSDPDAPGGLFPSFGRTPALSSGGDTAE